MLEAAQKDDEDDPDPTPDCPITNVLIAFDNENCWVYTKEHLHAGIFFLG